MIELAVALGGLLVGVISAVAWRKSYSKQRTVTETVDAPVLAEFLSLTREVTEIKLSLAEARDEIRELREQVEQYIKDEVAYQAELHEKDEQIEDLQMQLTEAHEERDALHERILHLEDVCQRAGINGEET